jgi:hypothetical protein
MSKQEQAVPSHYKGYAAQGVKVCLLIIGRWPKQNTSRRLQSWNGTVVLKPAETVCLSVLEFMKVMADIILPGVVDVITGHREDVGQALVAHPEVCKVAFTGSIPTARKVIQYASVDISVGGLELRRDGLRATGPINFSGECHFNSHTRKS